MGRALVIAFMLACTYAFAVDHDGSAADRINPQVLSEGFLSAHPDLRWRREGLYSYEQEQYGLALVQLRRASRYADKPSQALVAEMYWTGTGVARADRVLAYIWMDLAAERLYPDFVVHRERYWAELDEAERIAVLERGQAVYAEYGDDVAKPRLEQILQRERRKITGSRVGFVGRLTIIPLTGPLAGTGMSLDSEEYYADKYWKPEAYWALQDEIWRAPPRGRVEAGDLQPVRDPAPASDD